MKLRYTEISYAGYSYGSGIYSIFGTETSPSAVSLDHCNIHDISGTGVSLEGYHARINLQNNNFSNCDTAISARLRRLLMNSLLNTQQPTVFCPGGE